MIRQALQLDRKPHIIVATPGRLADHISSTHTLKLNRLRFLVLDEADRMLDAGFDDEMKRICAILPKTYQLLLFSATMSPVISLLVATLMFSRSWKKGPCWSLEEPTFASLDSAPLPSESLKQQSDLLA
jgi:superfamily II DNA/RNA helicase